MDEHAPDLTTHPKGEWVSKSDLVGYLRCPYAFWLLDTGQIQSGQALGWSSPRPRRQGIRVEITAGFGTVRLGSILTGS